MRLLPITADAISRPPAPRSCIHCRHNDICLYYERAVTLAPIVNIRKLAADMAEGCTHWEHVEEK